MKLTVNVRANSRQQKIEILPNGEYKISVNAPAHEGKANEAVVNALAKCLGVPKRAIKIVLGLKSKRKIIEVS